MTIRVLLCQVGQNPVSHEMETDMHELQKMVGGYVERARLEPNVYLWRNEEGLLQKLPLNVLIPAVAPRLHYFAPDFIFYLDKDLASPGEPGVYHIHGDFLIAREDADGEFTSLTDQDIQRYTALISACREYTKAHKPEPQGAL